MSLGCVAPPGGKTNLLVARPMRSLSEKVPMKTRLNRLLVLVAIVALRAGVTLGQKPASVSVEVPATASGKLLSGWLAAFNSGDEAAIHKFNTEHFQTSSDPERRTQRDLQFR